MTQGLPPFRVLSLDGGGMRGTYTATYLDKIADTFARRRNVGALDIGAGFDLIVGTSTGGIIAAALATGVPLSDIVALYVECLKWNRLELRKRHLPRLRNCKTTHRRSVSVVSAPLFVFP
jgi:patatin-like phospholipase/acyl hydrolase